MHTHKTSKLFAIALILLLVSALPAKAQYKAKLDEWITGYDTIYKPKAKMKIVRYTKDEASKEFRIYLNESFSFIQFRPETIERMQKEVQNIVGTNYKVLFFVDKVDVHKLIPNFYQHESKVDAKRCSPHRDRASVPLVTNQSRPYKIKRGLQGRHIALWNSHGWYYEQSLARWEWQRARLLETVEDKLSTAYVLDYLLPMLENAGANVLLPRERDTQTHEVIVDNDGSNGKSSYRESIRLSKIKTDNKPGFARPTTWLTDSVNPFTLGTCRTMNTDDKGTTTVVWQPDIPESGYYYVSVAYHSYTNSGIAHYAVYHDGGITHVDVNQKMGGETWVYLGRFHFTKGVSENGKVVLSSRGSDNKHVLSCDAVRFGGGMGNVARRPATAATIERLKTEYPKTTIKSRASYPVADYTISGRARYLEAARYYMQWSGIPVEVYEYTRGVSDYTDDYASRGGWVNYLLGGSVFDPDSVGLHIPIDLSLAFHTDAGNTPDTIVGTLAIYTLNDDKATKKETLPNGQSRYASRDLADLVSTSIVNDVRTLYYPNWNTRGVWNRNYAETRIPHTPSMILELLSHQNYEDMSLSLDPRFRFTVARSVYKGILKYLASQHNIKYVVQPLPVSRFAMEMKGDSVRLSWHPELDSLEKTATPHGYVVYTRIENGGFDNGYYVRDTTAIMPLPKGKIVSYKITAVNDGGESFPSEILAAYNNGGNKRALIINGFTRLSAPEGKKTNTTAGFLTNLDHGVTYNRDLSFVGFQEEFRRSIPWKSDDDPGFGASSGDYETDIVLGNSFDFCFTHGKALKAAGVSFVSTSVAAVEQGVCSINKYNMVDLILGEQRSISVACDNGKTHFQTFTPQLINALNTYIANGGRLMATGAYIGSDAYKYNINKETQDFLAQTLKIKYKSNKACNKGVIEGVSNPTMNITNTVTISTKPGMATYEVESTDAIEPTTKTAHTVMRYKENSYPAAVTYRDRERIFVCGFPFEAILDESQRSTLMKQIVKFLLED